MSKATESKLASLHGAVAEVLTDQVKRTEPETTFDSEGNCVETGEVVYSASPALVATAIKFLKDNQITCDITQDENMGKLKDALGRKTKHSRLNSGQAAAQEVH
ncbi:MAG: hypothetical protein KUG81_09595 [Gammaproteobacteria bacterium]|nr:hypothetical protein [Gammaproteobacteria bacterium]